MNAVWDKRPILQQPVATPAITYYTAIVRPWRTGRAEARLRQEAKHLSVGGLRPDETSRFRLAGNGRGTCHISGETGQMTRLVHQIPSRSAEDPIEEWGTESRDQVLSMYGGKRGRRGCVACLVDANRGGG